MATNETTINSFLDQFEPEETGNTVASDFLDQYQEPETPTAAPPTAAPPKMSLEQAAMMTHKPEPDRSAYQIRPEIITEGIKKGFSDFAALPGYAVDLVNWPLHKLGITPEEPVGGSEMIRKGWQLLTGYQDIEPETRAERVGQSVAEFAGSGIVPGAGLVSKTVSRGILPSAKAKPSKIREAFNIRGTGAQLPKLSAPATRTELAGILGVETASAITGGAGAEIGGEIGETVGPGGRVVGELMGGLSAGMAPVYFKSAGGAIWNSIRTSKTVLKDRESFMENAAKAKILESIGENPQSAENLARAAALQREIPGFDPNLAAATDSKGLAQLQGRLDTLSMDNYNRATENIRKSQEAIGHYYDQLFSVSGKKLKATRTFKHTLKALKTHAQDVDTQIEDLAKQFERKPTRQIGERLRQLRGVRKTAVRGDVDQAYTDLYKAADDLGVVDDVSDLYALAQQFTRQDRTAFQRMPGVYAKMREVFGREIDPDIPLQEQKIMVDFPKMHSLYRQVSREYGKAMKSGDAEKEFYLHQVKELLDNKMQAFDDPLYGSFADHKKAVDNFWLEEYHNVFRKGVGGKIPHETRWGEVTPDEMIVKKLVLQKGTDRGIREFNKLYENVPEAQVLLRDGILDDFASKVISKGKIDSGQIRQYLNNYKEIFDQIPDLRNTFMNADTLTTALVNRQSNIVSKSRKFATATISPYAKIAGFESPRQAVEAGLKSPKIMRILTRNAKTEAERKDLTSIIADVVMDQPEPWSYILKNEETLAKHFNRLAPGHYKKLKHVAEANQITGQYQPPKYKPSKTSEDPFYKRFGTTFASALSQWRWALLYNKTSVYYPAADMGSKYLNKIRENHIDNLMERAVYDPDLATTMAELSKIKPTELSKVRVMDLLSKIGMHAINNGIRVGVTALPEETPEP